MIDFKLDESSVRATADHLEQTRINILAGIRLGMAEGMEGLAKTVSQGLHGNPIAERTGDLLSAVLRSPRVTEGENYIAGEVSTTTGKFRNKGLWLEFGTKYPTKGKNLANYPHQFLAGGTTSSKGLMGHGAFRIEPKPFFNPAFEEYCPTILETINERIAEACDG